MSDVEQTAAIFDVSLVGTRGSASKRIDEARQQLRLAAQIFEFREEYGLCADAHELMAELDEMLVEIETVAVMEEIEEGER